MSAFILPVMTGVIFFIAIIKKVDIISSFTEGVKNGLNTVLTILPILIFVLAVIQMLRISGVLDYFVMLLSPAVEKLNIPPEILPTVLLKPFSGSGSLAMLENTIQSYGVDSRIGRLTAVIAAASETTFYTISVYLGALTKKCGKIIICALITDFVTVLFASFFVS